MPYKLKSREKAYQRKWKVTHKESIKATSKAYYLKNKKRIKTRSAAWRKANPKRYKFLLKRWSKKNLKRLRLHARRYRQKHKLLLNARVKAWKKNNPDAAKSARLKCSYGITLEEFFELQKKQKNKCAICRNTFDKTPHVDHCHQTGNIRGLLCGHCNRGLGMFKDSLETLKFAMKYLKCSIKSGVKKCAN